MSYGPDMTLNKSSVDSSQNKLHRMKMPKNRSRAQPTTTLTYDEASIFLNQLEQAAAV